MWDLLPRDERETGIDRAADRFAYLVLSYGLLLLAAYRSFVDASRSTGRQGGTAAQGRSGPAGWSGRSRADGRD